MERNDFIKSSSANGRTNLANMPHAVGDSLKFTKIEEKSIEGTGNKFNALVTDDDRFISANAALRAGNGISYGTRDMEEAAGKLYDAVYGPEGLTLTIAKIWRSESASGNKNNNYRFNATEL